MTHIPVLTFFNNKGGVGKTSLVYHLSWMYANAGKRILTVDLDPQSNLTAAFLKEEEIEAIWNAPEDQPTTVYRSIKPLSRTGDIEEPILHSVARCLHLVPGDVALTSFEDTLSESWPDSMDDKNLYRHFRILTSFWLAAQLSARRVDAELIIVDVGPNLGAINRSVMIASDYVVIPLGADLFSLQGLKNLGPTLRSWRNLWEKRIGNWNQPEFNLPSGRMQPLGYLIQQHSVRLSRPVKAYDQWINRMPAVYAESVLEEKGCDTTTSNDPHCLGTLKHYRSLMPLAQEARKPIFALTPADGAIGSHATAVKDAYDDFKKLSDIIETRIKDLK